MNKLLITFAVFLLVVASTSTVLAKGGNSGRGGDDRVRIEVRADDDEPDENRVRVEVRGDGANITEAINLINSLDMPEDVNRVRVEARDDDDRIRVELRGDDEDEDELPNFEIEGNTFEITGAVTAFTGGTVTIDGRVITINTSAPNFEQEGTIEVGEVIKVEGMVAANGSLVAREIKANGVEEEASLSGSSLSALLSQIMVFLKSLT